MAASSILIRSLKNAQIPALPRAIRPRYLSTVPGSSPTPAEATRSQRPQSWLTRKVKSSPTALKVFLGVAKILGYGSPQQIAARRSLLLYRELCSVRADEESAFWMRECHLPPTFQSWFTITNLHVWLLTVRVRALPNPQGSTFIQGLLDNFFIDVEDRIRAILQPGLVPPHSDTLNTKFYSVPKAIAARTEGVKNAKAQAPERVVTQQMKILREQWTGMGMALDLGLMKGDTEMAGAVWRNLLGARGARGILLPSDGAAAHEPLFRRNINPAGEIEKFSKMEPQNIEAEEAKDDGSGVHDFGPNESDQYVKYPETMVALVSYIRKELVRLERLSDDAITGPLTPGTQRQGISGLRFGPVEGL